MKTAVHVVLYSYSPSHRDEPPALFTFLFSAHVHSPGFILYPRLLRMPATPALVRSFAPRDPMDGPHDPLQIQEPRPTAFVLPRLTLSTNAPGRKLPAYCITAFFWSRRGTCFGYPLFKIPGMRRLPLGRVLGWRFCPPAANSNNFTADLITHRS